MSVPAARLRSALVAGGLLLVAACSSQTTGQQAESNPTTAGAGAASAELVSVQADVGRLAPELESFVRGGAYPTDLAGALAALAKAGLAPSAGNTVAGYVYDLQTVEFTLCVESASGAFATYDTRPMSLRQQGESGGCAAAS